MKELHSLEEVTDAFLTYAPADIKRHYNLVRMRQLMTVLDNPQEKIRVIHVAGTSGKTSTSYFIRGCLEAAGQKTGLTVSPHVVAINERVQISGVPLLEEKFLPYANDFLALVKAAKLRPTYYELVVALAYWIFAKENVDYAVIETGCGGLLDGTNVVSRADKVCVITDIGLDHTQLLGETLVEIAAQKAGIIQPNNHLIVRGQSAQIMDVFMQTVKRQQASVKVVEDTDSPFDLIPYQQRNWAMAFATFCYVAKRDRLKALTNRQKDEVARQTPPGRWELFNVNDKTIILDGAHNPQKMQALYESLAKANVGPVTTIMNFVESVPTKVIDAATIIQPITAHLIIPEFSVGQDLRSRRSLSAQEFTQIARHIGFSSIDIEKDLNSSLQKALQRPEKTILITGSIYMISLIRPLLPANHHVSITTI